MSEALAESFDKRAEFYKGQLKSAEDDFKSLIDFADLGIVPLEMQDTFAKKLRPWTQGGELDFFSPEIGQPIFFHLIAKLTSHGIDLPAHEVWDVTKWMKLQPQNPQPVTGGENVQPGATGITQQPQPSQGRMGHFTSAIGAAGSKIGNLLAGPSWDDLESLDREPEEPFDPYNHIAKVYDGGCVEVKEYGTGAAPAELRKIRQAIVMYVSGLLRVLRTYINEQVHETGRQLTQVASA